MADSGNSPPLARSVALAKLLRRGASVREPPRRRSSPELDDAEASASAATDGGADAEDSPLYATAFLDRTVSLLARSMAMAKLTGTAQPVAPASYYIKPDNESQTGFSRAPLPTLDALRERAEAKVKNAGGRPTGLRRNNTVTGVGVREFGTDLSSPATEKQSGVSDAAVMVQEEAVVPLDRAEARTNLMRKLSARRLAPKGSSPLVLAVVGKQGQSRPRSGSLGDTRKDWTTGAPPVPQMPHSPLVPILDPAPVQPPLSRQTSGATERQRSPPPPLVLSPQSRFANPASPDWSGDRDMRARLQAQELADASGDEGYDSTIGYADTPNANATPKMFSEFEWTPSRPATGEQPRYDSDPPSPSSASVRQPSVGPRISDTTTSSDSVPLVLRRGSIPQHLFSGRFPSSMSTLSSIEAGDSRAHKTASFGIGAVEDTDIRRRGSSASSILAFAGPMHRSSEAGFAFNESRLGAQRSFDTVSSSSSVRMPSSIDTRRSDASEQIEYVERRTPDSQQEEIVRKSKEVELAAKVEQKRESGLMRSREGAFPPPEAGYQFPSPPATSFSRFSEDTSRSPYESIGPYDPPPIHSVPFAPHRSHPPPSRFVLRGQLSTIPQIATPASPILEQSAAPSPIIVTHERTSSKESLARLIGLPVVQRLSQETPLVAGLDRGTSLKSSKSTRTVESRPPESPSLDSVRSIEVGEGDRSGYSSSNEMKRDLSSSSAGSFSFEPRQNRMPAEQLPANRILRQLDSILGTEQLESDEPSALDTPPRQLLLHAPVLQVVNANTVKDRHLFLFTDLLLIAKPIIHDDPLTGQPLPSNLDNSFIVKSIVELCHLKLVASEETTEDVTSKKRHPLLLAFVDRFANDPKRAVASLIQKGGLTNDGATIANLLFRNPDLNRNQLGSYLSARENKHTLRLYIERFRFGGVRLDDALRMFLMTVRLPHNLESAEYVLSVIASQWTEMNGTTGFDPSLTLSLVLAIMKLSDALHAGLSTEESLFSFPNSAITVDDFIAAFRERDTRLLVPEDLLTRIYASVRKEKIEQASDNSMFSMTPDIEATMEPAKLPTRLTYRTPSDLITITIPAPDAKFSIKLHGTDLKFEPNVLSFARSATQSFRVTGSALGVRAMVLIKYGANAPRYQGLPLNKAFSIERAFMQHTFQISFVNHLDIKRKYMFSTLSQDVRSSWTKGLRERIEACVARPAPASRALLAGEMVAVQVLRDALIAPEDPPPLTSFAAPSPRLNSAAPRFGTAGPLMSHLAPPRSAARTGTGNSARSAQGILMRSNSISKTYAAGIGKVEADLITESGSGRKASTFSAARGGQGSAPKEEEHPFAKAGSEIALITEQNSLLPLVLSFLRAGASVAPHPVSVNGSAFQHRPLTPPLSSSTAHSPDSPQCYNEFSTMDQESKGKEFVVY